jgi:hypothetical protein
VDSSIPSSGIVRHLLPVDAGERLGATKNRPEYPADHRKANV